MGQFQLRSMGRFVLTIVHSRFWDVIKDTGIDTSLARWAADHIKEHRRPLRIAIDEAHWRYKAITVEAFEEIKRSSSPHCSIAFDVLRTQPAHALSSRVLTHTCPTTEMRHI